ncbi:hypothetical protein NPIL_678121 [Nephila pilipes]|uniref:Uncharacterized protein n=1 Tax=Nephila pilipes TaxID=299642 RepID=A0A8X6MCD2_NEPPI|nr:hypothetical protein NPIL_678121 [Nephila pilipes]
MSSVADLTGFNGHVDETLSAPKDYLSYRKENRSLAWYIEFMITLYFPKENESHSRPKTWDKIKDEIKSKEEKIDLFGCDTTRDVSSIILDLEPEAASEWRGKKYIPSLYHSALR